MLMSTDMAAAPAALATYQQCAKYDAYEYRDAKYDDDNGGDAKRSLQAPEQPVLRGAGPVACLCGSDMRHFTNPGGNTSPVEEVPVQVYTYEATITQQCHGRSLWHSRSYLWQVLSVQRQVGLHRLRPVRVLVYASWCCVPAARARCGNHTAYQPLRRCAQQSARPATGFQALSPPSLTKMERAGGWGPTAHGHHRARL
jgi:hypothetical protein